MALRSRNRHDDGSETAADPTGEDTQAWLAGLGQHAAGEPARWPEHQARQALSLLLARTDHPDAFARAAVVLRAGPDSTEAEYRYGLRAWPYESGRCEGCGQHHGPAAVCRECGTAWNITAEEPLYDHRPDPDYLPGGLKPLAGLCFGCGITTASLPAPRHALTAGPPCEADPAECPACGSAEPGQRGYVPGGTGQPVECGSDWHPGGATGPGQLEPAGQDCGCPSRDGKVYHQRGTCTDPLVAKLDWYADDGAAPSETAGELEPGSEPPTEVGAEPPAANGTARPRKRPAGRKPAAG